MSDDFAKAVTDDDVSKALKDDPNRIAVIGMVSRPGVRSFLIATEWRLFCPLDEALNAKFDLILKRWQEMIFTIMIFPAEYREQVDKIAEDLHLRIVHGAPVVIGEEVSRFPIHCDEDRMFSIENSHGAAVYENKGNLFDQETERLDAFEREEKAKAAARYQ